MSPWVTALVLGSALLHASWNAIIKSSREVMLDTALVAAGAGLLALPLAALVPLPAGASWPYLGASAAIHVGYFSTLVAAYRVGDLGHAYPLMRGIAPLLVALFGVVLLDEHPSASVWLGIALISAGILSLGLLQRGRAQRAATLWALANAAIIAGYTLVDGTGARLSDSPAGYVAALFWLQGLLFVTLVAILRQRAAFEYAARNWQRGLIGGLFLISAYGIVLWAMTRAPVAAVAALRETSVIFAALLGSLFLKEPFGRQRLFAACAVALGVIALRN
ncbi:MAG: EamA family transporter [Burkholderiales bacterium]|jgi:phosphonate utilization associated putative membrane protein